MSIIIFTTPPLPDDSPLEVPDPMTPLQPGAAIVVEPKAAASLEIADPRSPGVYGVEQTPAID